MDQRSASVAQLWEAHLRAPFPSGLGGTEVEGVDLVLLDADAAGCVRTWLDNGGHLDDWRRSVVSSCSHQLDLVLPVLADEAAGYYRRLRDLTALIA
ncbi:hypothetical protein ONA70_25965 [Micromonospora yasonensis]|uniref:hypothetical protein n=1 Tax=Micromonospora yasonensis TaxID=1128667 RepID=UPI00222FAE84|nr:hypothetical protein [Micromonospora yasonensis]MCW3843554.1 hypothetical protein [Micromonospora yasonensis]